MLGFVIAEFVVGVGENLHNRDQRFKLPTKAAHTPRQNGEVMTQVCADSFDRESVVFVVNIACMLAWIDHADVAQIPVCAVFQRGRRDGSTAGFFGDSVQAGQSVDGQHSCVAAAFA